MTFERLCLLHSSQIKEALGISGVISSEYSWKTEGTEEEYGAQIDLLIDRNDAVINLCEMKFSKTTFRITKGYSSDLQNKLMRFMEVTHTKKAVRITMVTTEGLVSNSYSDEILSQITSDKLFRY